jgi:hypothetical protein
MRCSCACIKCCVWHKNEAVLVSLQQVLGFGGVPYACEFGGDSLCLYEMFMGPLRDTKVGLTEQV